MGTAALGMLLGGGGVSSALEALGSHPDDWLIRTALIRRAAEIDVERRNAELKALGEIVGSKVGDVLARVLRAMAPR